MTSRGTILALLCVGHATLVPLACRAAESPPNILLISLDACRADHLGAYGYARQTSPFIDSVAGRGIRFANAFVNTHGTPSSHATMLTSLYQETHRVAFNDAPGQAQYRVPDEVSLLPEHLQRAGYTTIGVTGGGWMAGEFGWDRGFTAFDGQTKTGVGVGRLLRLVDQHGGGERPLFVFLHTYSIHSPYTPPDEYRRRWGVLPGRFEATSENLAALSTGKLRATEADVHFVKAMYDAGIRYTDDALRRLFEELERRGFFRDYLVVITADHGEELGERGVFLHPDLLYDELLHVPLVLAGTAVPRGRTEGSLASTVDVAPTILRAAGVTVDGPLEGRDLLSSPGPDAVFAQFAGGRYAIRTTDWKLIVNREPRSVELFDLRNDPAELANAAARLPEKARELERRLWSWKAGRRSLRSLTPSPVEMSEEVRERLRALGYLN